MSNWDELANLEPVILKDGVPKQIRISGYEFGDMSLTDAVTQQPKTVKGLRLHVIWEDGSIVDKDLNIVSKRLIARLRPYLEGKTTFTLLFEITAQGTGLETDYSVIVS